MIDPLRTRITSLLMEEISRYITLNCYRKVFNILTGTVRLFTVCDESGNEKICRNLYLCTCVSSCKEK